MGTVEPEPGIGAGGPWRLAATAPPSLAVRLPEVHEHGVELRRAVTAASDEPGPVGVVEPSVRRPRRHRQPSIVTERRLRALLERHGRARQHPARADLVPRPRIVLRR